MKRAAVYLPGMNSLLRGAKFGRAVQSSSVLGGGESSPVTQRELGSLREPVKAQRQIKPLTCVPLSMHAECEAAAYQQIIRDLNSSRKQIPGG